MLDKLTKSNVLAFAGLALLSAALPALLPNMRPALKSAIKMGFDLLSESEFKAEAELVESLITLTIDGMRQDFAKSTDDSDWRDAAHKRVRHFKHQANIRAQRWADDQRDHRTRYRRHLALLKSSLVERKQRVGTDEQQILDYAMAALASEA